MRRYYFEGNGRRYSLAIEHVGNVASDWTVKAAVQYTFKRTNERTPIFTGDDFRCSPMYDPESRDAAMSLMGFLTLQPGDTDDDYFDSYTPEQLEFARYEAEELATYPYGWESRKLNRR
jgi:hypothetical protein